MAMMDTIDKVDDGAGRPCQVPSRRRRYWSRAEKERIVAETYEPGASVSTVARRNDVNANLVFTWRRKFRTGRTVGDGAMAPVLVPVKIAPSAPHSSSASGPAAAPNPPLKAGAIEIDLGDGRCVRVGRDVDGDALRRVLVALERR